MLSKISWSEFIWFIVFLSIPYYLFVLTVYFRKEIRAFIRNPVRRREPLFEAATLSGAEPFINPQVLPVTSSSDDISLSVVHDLLEDMKNIFSSAAKTRMVKEELVHAIHSKLKTYPNLQDSDLQEDIANYIKIELRDRCGIELTSDDIQRLWHS